ncbi:GGDEF domain-containing protein [Marinomonas sp.]|uniref:GGDEF domain-containing protein n=1 Tax=Marinomonas sp. TaxID=1904862 RepID=UPI003BADA750
MKKQLSTSHWFKEDSFSNSLLRAFLLVIGVSCLLLVALNIYVMQYSFALLEFTLLTLTVGVWFCPKDWRYYQLATFIYVAFIFGCILAGIAFSPLYSGRQVWVFVFPMSSYLLLGKRAGFWFSSISYCLVSIILFARFYEDFGSDLVRIFVNMTFTYVFVWGLTYGAELTHRKMLHTLKKIATTDPLTGLANRRGVATKYQNELSKAEKSGDGLAFILIDLDHFKKVNDTFGHEVGDAVLVDFANHLRAHFDDNEHLFRIGGEEFCVFMPAAQSKDWAETFCQFIDNNIFQFEGQSIHYTVSIGISTSNKEGRDFTHLYAIADQRLYKAKSLGRNCVVLTD